ncbi:MAG: lactonase family protein [Candidatus Binataceae bacterium]
MSSLALGAGKTILYSGNRARRDAWPAMRVPMRQGTINYMRALQVAVIVALSVATASCNGGLFENGGGSSTPAPAAGAGEFAYVTNFKTGKVSRFRRNRASGALNLKGTTSAGADNGPRGVAIHPTNQFLYVANAGDHRTYQFSIDLTDGSLTPIGAGFISNGSGAGTDQIAIDPSGDFAWATNFGNGTISGYKIDTSTGALTDNGMVTSLTSPFGIIVHATLALLFVSDNFLGKIFTYTINTSTGAITQLGAGVASLGGSTGSPGLMALSDDGDFLFVADVDTGVVSTFAVNGGALLFGGTFSTGALGSEPIGILDLPTVASEFVFTANQTAANVSEFTNSAGILTSVGALNGVSGATGIAADPDAADVYVANIDNGTVTQLAVNSETLAAV